MNCPSCNGEISTLNGYTCPFCGVDVVMLKKAERISCALYNQGLELAKKSNLSAAIVSLSKSLRFNKNNVPARNLLGLVYYETGRIGDALKHWIISASLVKSDTTAKRYISDIHQNPRTNEKLDDAVNMYNNALSYIANKNDDMAIIQLKKAIDISPKFIDAMNALALCYLSQKSYHKASHIIERILEIDVSNETALRYYKELIDKRKKPLSSVVEIKEETSDSKYSGSFKKGTVRKSIGFSNFLSEIICFILGCILTVAAMYILVIPSMNKENEATIASLNTNLAAKTLEAADIGEKSDNQIKELEAEIKRLNDEIYKQNEQIYSKERLQTVATADKLVAAGDFMAAADMLYSADLTGVPPDIEAKANELKEKSFKTAATTLYNDGLNKYRASEYDTARAGFEKALRFAEKVETNVDNITYYLGMTALALENSEAAKRYFTAIVEDFPNSPQVARAKKELEKIGD